MHVKDATHVVSLAFGFEDGVVALAAYVLADEQELFVALLALLHPVCRVLPAPLGVEPPLPVFQLIELFVVNIVVEENLLAL